MIKRFFTLFLSMVLSLGISGLAFAATDLDLGDDSGGGMKQIFFTIKAGYDMEGTINVDWEQSVEAANTSSDSESYDVNSAFSAGIELGTAVSENICIGGGAVYQFPRGLDEDTGYVDPKFNFLPIYGLLKLVAPMDRVIPFGVVNIGYNFLYGNYDFKLDGDLDLNGGLYWGIGGGIMLENGLQFELLYTQNRGKGEYSFPGYQYTEEYVYKKITISFGINL